MMVRSTGSTFFRNLTNNQGRVSRVHEMQPFAHALKSLWLVERHPKHDLRDQLIIRHPKSSKYDRVRSPSTGLWLLKSNSFIDIFKGIWPGSTLESAELPLDGKLAQLSTCLGGRRDCSLRKSLACLI
jgi:hypothetical protein